MRRPSAPYSPGVSLFPFLAVLICTMGALIVLLVVITRNSRLQAAAEAAEAIAAEAPSAESPELAIERESLDWRIGLLEESRQMTVAQLAEERKRLSGVEEHLRRLQAKWAELQQAAVALESSGKLDSQQQEAIRAELARLSAEIPLAAAACDEARQAARVRPASYAVVPFAGPNQTARRPIYIECRGDQIVLQPEGVVFRTRDFETTLGPSNPLAAALRAGREHLVAQAQLAGATASDPYPLLLVRPDAVTSYHFARHALSSWGSEFGYEFVDQDWTLKCGVADPQLATVEQAAADQARKRLAAMEKMKGAGIVGGRPVYRAAPILGGIMREDGPPQFETPRNSLRATREEDSNAEGGPADVGTGASGGPSGRSAQTAGARAFGDPAATGGPNTELAPKGSEATAAAAPAAKRSVAESRGSGWGLQERGSRAVRLTRPIRIECRADQLIILPEKGSRGGRSIALPPQTEAAVDELVQAIWDHTREWGLAGPDMKWRPTLILETGPGGEGRMADLEVLFRDSGLPVEKAW